MTLLSRLLALLLPIAGSTSADIGPHGPYGVDIPGGISHPSRVQYGPVGAQNFVECIPHPRAGAAAGQAGGFAGPYPAILLVHGGGWDGGNNAIDDTAAYSGRWCRNFASYGLHVFSIGYRLTPDAPWPAQISDLQAAIRYIRAHAAELRVTEKFIGCMGDSAGGQMCGIAAFAPANVTTDNPDNPAQSPQPQAAILFQAPWQWGPRHEPGLASSHVADYFASLLASEPPGSAPPTMFVAGTRDVIVPPCAGERPTHGVFGFNALREAGQQAHFRSFVGGHEFSHIPDAGQPGRWAATVEPVIASEISFFVEQAQEAGLLPAADVGPRAPLDDPAPPHCPL